MIDLIGWVPYYRIMTNRESPYKSYLQARQTHGLRRSLRDVRQIDATTLLYEGQKYLNFSSNDYLGLSHHPELAKRGCEWAQNFGSGSGASRLVTGNINLFSEVEAKIAKFKNVEAVTILASGFQANATVLHALFSKTVLGAEPLIFADELIHASMHFGCWAARTPYKRYRHLDMAHLQSLLEDSKDNAQPRFILSETVFSMDGDCASLEELRALADHYDATIILDDAHAFGILGEGGRGLSDLGDITIGTFSKGMGSFGAYVTSSETVRDYLINRCSGLIYSTGLPPSILGSIDAALDLVPGMDSERERVSNYADKLRSALNDMDIDTGGSTTQIVPVIVGSARAALGLGEALRVADIWAVPIRPPTVPDGTARLRIVINAAHRAEHIDHLISVIGVWNRQQRAA